MISLTKTPLLQGIGERERILFLVYIYIFQKALKTRNKILSPGVFIIGPNRVGLLEWVNIINRWCFLGCLLLVHCQFWAYFFLSFYCLGK